MKFQPFGDGTVTSVAKLTPSQLGTVMTLSPDAKTLLTTRREGFRDIAVLYRGFQ